MSGVVRRTVELSVEQNDFLQRRSREIGVTEDELVRRAIDAMNDDPDARSARRNAWTRLKSAMEQRTRIDVPQSGRTWAREDLYETDGRV